MTKKIVLIGSKGDIQIGGWYSLAKDLNHDASLLDVSEYGSTWSVVISPRHGACITRQGACSYSFDDEGVCWYIRSPLFGDHKAIQALSLVEQLLAASAYPIGNYLSMGCVDYVAMVKPLHFTISTFSHPETWITSRFVPSFDVVVKSISSVRSIVVYGDDARLNHNQSIACPSLVQKYIKGSSVKIHCYRTRSTAWMFLVVSTTSEQVDHRYDVTAKHCQISFCDDYIDIVNDLYRTTGNRFFDIDLIIDHNGSIRFLEYNNSPAPVYFERLLGPNPARLEYSSNILTDWLNG